MNKNNFINEKTIKDIDLDYFLDLLDILTPYGKDKLKSLEPFKKGQENLLIKEFDNLEKVIDFIKNDKFNFNRLEKKLKEFKDIRKTIENCKNGFVLSEIELYEVKYFVLLLKELHEIQKCINLNELVVTPVFELQKLLDPENNNLKTFYIYDSYSEKLKIIRESKKNIKENISIEYNLIKNKIIEELNLKFKLNGEVIISKKEVELIEKVTKYPLLTYKSETYMDIVFKIKDNEKIDFLKENLQRLELEEEKEELSVREILSKKVREYSSELTKNIEKIANLDFKLSKAKMAIKTEGVKPELINEKKLEIVNGRYLKLEKVLNDKNKRFIPISINLSNKVTCITGANMGGKTITLKLIGLLTTLAHLGFFVPCSSMKFFLLDYVFTSIGDSQSIEYGLSSFGSEIENIKYVLNRKNEEGLILLDELGRGTNPYEGYAITKAIINYLKHKNNITVLTTHFDNIADDKEINHLQVIGLSNVDFTDIKDLNLDSLNEIMDYRLIEVKNKKTVPKDAINIAKVLGLNDEIIIDAEKIIKTKFSSY